MPPYQNQLIFDFCAKPYTRKDDRNRRMPNERESFMSKFGSKNSAKDWVRLAAKLSLLFTEPKVRAAITDHFKDGFDEVSSRVSDKYDDVSSRVSSTYDDAADRLEAAAEALQGKSQWPAHLTGFLLGAGVGIGLGILLAPASGEETRHAVADATGRAFESASNATSRFKQSVSRMPSTGTEA